MKILQTKNLAMNWRMLVIVSVIVLQTNKNVNGCLTCSKEMQKRAENIEFVCVYTILVAMWTNIYLVFGLFFSPFFCERKKYDGWWFDLIFRLFEDELFIICMRDEKEKWKRNFLQFFFPSLFKNEWLVTFIFTMCLGLLPIFQWLRRLGGFEGAFNWSRNSLQRRIFFSFLFIRFVGLYFYSIFSATFSFL